MPKTIGRSEPCQTPSLINRPSAVGQRLMITPNTSACGVAGTCERARSRDMLEDEPACNP